MSNEPTNDEDALSDETLETVAGGVTLPSITIDGHKLPGEQLPMPH